MSVSFVASKLYSVARLRAHFELAFTLLSSWELS